MAPLKLVDTPHYHLWTDALHARELARQAKNRWDRGTYVRWTVTTAWTVLEMSCEDVLNEPGVGWRFKESLKAACLAAGIEPPDWGRGVWQEVGRLQQARNDFVHKNADQSRLFPDVSEAERAIDVVRRATADFYDRAGKAPPLWLQDDEDKGWDQGSTAGAHAALIHAGVDPAASTTVRTAYVYKDKEYVCDERPSCDDLESLAADLISRMNLPISAVRVYRGTTLVLEKPLNARGA